MNINIKLEKLPPATKEAKVGKVHVEINQEIKVGEALLEIEGKKGNMQVKSEVEGKLVSLEVEEGDTVSKGDLLASVETSVEEADKDLENLASKGENLQADITILGAGPGGYVAAIQAAKLGAKVIVIEEESLGGTCLNWGCIPTKALVRSGQVFKNIKNAEEFGISLKDPFIDMKKVIKRKDEIVDNLIEGIKHLFDQHKITLIKGRGKILDKNTVEVSDGRIINSENIIIATGSEVSKAPFPGTDLDNVLDSRDALSLEELPDRITIIGGGIIGMEFAFIYANMGVEVSLVEYMDNILFNLDDDIIEEITSSAKESGIKLYTSSKVEEILNDSDGKCIVRFTKDNKTQYLTSDKVLSAVGRSPQYENIGIEDLSIEINESTKGINVNHKMETNIPGIYAIGDVTNIMQLAHVASHQGIIAVKNILGQDKLMDYKSVPSAIFTSPEIATVGIGEKDIKDSSKTVVNKFPFAANGKAMTYGETRGFVKVIKDKEKGKILGASIIGPNASDLVAELTLAIQNDLTAEDIINTIHAHPTTSEAIHEGALSVEGGALHFAD